MSNHPNMGPVDPPQPAHNPFSVGELAQYRRITREQYRQMAGKQAPPFDPSRGQKLWWNSGAAADYVYTAFNYQDGTFYTVTMPKEEAQEPNLPGDYDYPDYAPTSPATINGHTAVYILSSTEQADKLATDIGAAWVDAGFEVSGGKLQVFVDTFTQSQIQMNGETRQVHRLLYPDGGSENCGQLLKRQNEKGNDGKGGVGYPGKWVVRAPTVTWNRATDLVTSGEEVAMPVRALLPNEQQPVAAGVGQWVIYKEGTGPDVPPGGGYTDSDRARDVETHQMIKAIHNRFA